MIRLSGAQRWAFAGVAGGVAVFVFVGAAVNASMRHWRDAGLLAALAALLGYLIWLRWARFVEVDAEGLRYNNWGLARSLPWSSVERFDIRRAMATKGPGSWLVVAHLGAVRTVTLRATARTGSYRTRPSPGEQAARALAAEFDDLRRRAKPG